MAKRPQSIQLRLTLTAQAKAHIDRQVSTRGYRDASAYVEACIAKDRGVPTLSSLDSLDELLTHAVASGPARPLTGRDWARLKRAAAGPAVKSTARVRRRTAG